MKSISYTTETVYRPEPISIPAQAKDWALSQLPLSVRLSGVLQKMGFRKLGDLNGVFYEQIICMRNCGQRSIRELKALMTRIVAGEFDYNKVKGLGLDVLVQLIDAAVAKISERERKMLLYRLGGTSEEPMTLEEIGDKYGLTRERVRQVVDLLYARVYKAGGPAVNTLLERLAEKCLSNVLPLTPALLEQWMGKDVKPTYPTGFYVRLSGELNPDIPAWAEGQKPYPNLDIRSKDIIRPTVEMLRKSISPLPLKDAFKELQKSNNPPNLTVREYLHSLKQCCSITVDFDSPEKPILRLSSLRIYDWVQRVLNRATRPLKPEEIIAEAKKMFGTEVPSISIGGLRNSLRPEQGIFLLDRRAFGMKQHISLPENLWKQVRDDVVKLLQTEERPVSTREILRNPDFEWAEQTNVHEVAHVLREDERLVDLGRFLFALKDWGVNEREHIKDLIPQALKAAGHPMTATDILKELRRKRSVGRATISAVIRHHEGVKEYGFGYYGLKNWGEISKSFYVEQPLLIRRIILKAPSPLTFGGLCQMLKIPTKGKYAEKLWQTIKGLRRIRLEGSSKNPETCVIHKNWKSLY